MYSIILSIKRKSQGKSQACLLKYLTVRLAPVLVKVKPSSLVALVNCLECERKDHCRLWEKQWEEIVKTLRVSFKELKDTPSRKQLLFYNPEELFNTLTQPENLSYLKKFGYSHCIYLNDYLELLKSRFNNSSFPHEIGIFLGYPLKDVKGFIEKGSLSLVNIGRWQVFGELGESMQLMRLHRRAEEIFSRLIENQKNPLPLRERLGWHFQKVKVRVTAEAS